MRRLPDQLAITLDPGDTRPLHEQIRVGINDAILAGRLKPGARVPSSRALAEHLAISRNTVAEAFEQLVAEGSLESRAGSGHYVSHALAHAEIEGRAGRAGSENRSRVRWSAQGDAFSRLRPNYLLPSTQVRPFRLAAPALDQFPSTIWRRIQNRLFRSIKDDSVRKLLWEGEPAGLKALRVHIADYIAAARGVHCDPDQIVIVAGAQQALYLASMLLLDAGDEVWVEDPGYLSAYAAFQGARARIIPVPVDDNGLRVGYGERVAPGARLAYVTPSKQFPMGSTMSLSRRLQLLDWAQRADAWILEDDYDSEYRYEGRPIMAMQGLDNADRVLYVGTFSKALFPALRLGYVVLPKKMVRTFVAAKAVVDRHCPVIEQAVLAQFIEEGHLTSHVRRMRKLYRERQDALIASCNRHLGRFLTVEKTGAGLQLLAWLREGLDEEAVSRAAARVSIDVVPLSRFTLSHQYPPALVLGFAAYRPEEIDNAAARLAQAISR